jgi:hypothetical protein
MIGCASFEGTNPDALAPAALVPASFCARTGRMARQCFALRVRVDMNRMAKDVIDTKAALHACCRR